jgi:hypothetical protein
MGKLPFYLPLTSRERKVGSIEEWKCNYAKKSVYIYKEVGDRIKK